MTLTTHVWFERHKIALSSFHPHLLIIQSLEPSTLVLTLGHPMEGPQKMMQVSFMEMCISLKLFYIEL